MNAPLDELYFTWLCRQVGCAEGGQPSQTYWKLLRQLYNKEFLWFVAYDDNRAKDGLNLRREFTLDEGLTNVDRSWMKLGCSMLELFIVLARGLEFEAGGESSQWFWHMLENVKLRHYNDSSAMSSERIDEILDCIIFRKYQWNGEGGIFPLRDAQVDQREVELWYQLNFYLIEGNY